MATITARTRKDGTISHVAQIIKRAGGKTIHQESKSFPNRKTAEAWVKKREAAIATQIESGQPISSPKQQSKTLGDAIDLYVTESTKAVGKTKSQVLKTIRDEYDIAKMRCDQITARDLTKFANEIAARPGVTSPATVNSYMASLSTIFRNAKALWGLPLSKSEFDDAMISLSAMGHVAKSKKRSRRPSVDEVNKLMDHFVYRSKTRPNVNPMHRVIAFAMFSARRQEEITRLLWEDLDEKNSRILVRSMKHPGQTIGNDVWVELPEVALGIIKTMPRTGTYIFPYSVDAISAAMTRACKFLEIDDLHFHDFRHEATSRLFEMGKTIPQAAQVTGHRSWQSLQRYSHIIASGDKWANWEWIDKLRDPDLEKKTIIRPSR